MARSKGPKRVQCYHCSHRFDVSGMAESTSCPGCNKPLFVADIHIKGRKLKGPYKEQRTCGKIKIDRGSRLIAEHVEAHGGIEVQGILEAKHILSGKPVLVGGKATMNGDLSAPGIEIRSGGKAKGYWQIPDDPKDLAGLEDEE